MTQSQRIIKYAALTLAALLIVGTAISILQGLSFLMSLGGGEGGELKPVTVEGEIKSLDLDLSATSLTIRTGETFSVETNNERLKFEERAGVLSVDEKVKSLFDNRNETALILTVPADLVFESVEISTGAGQVEIDVLYADRVEFELGAGEMKIGALYTSLETAIEGGAGRIEIGGGSVAGLDFDMGVGELILKARVLGDGEIDCGVGSTELTLIGSDADYTLDVSKGLGEVTLDGTALRDGDRLGDGENRIRISGGVGSIDIRITEE